MVRKIKISNVVENEESPQPQEPEEHVNKTEPDVAVCEATPELETPDAANAESAAPAIAAAIESEPSRKPDAAKVVVEQASCQACGKCMSAENL